MKLRDNQTFLSLYYEPNAVEVATGEADAFASAESWPRETKQLGQVATPERIAVLMDSPNRLTTRPIPPIVLPD